VIMEHVYPKHMYDSIRIEIAAQQMQHEFRKLLPSISDLDWPKYDRDIESWFVGKKSELAPIHDFWNGFEGIMRGFKLKGLLQWVTAENIIWKEVNVPVKEIVFVWNIPDLSFIGRTPYLAQSVISSLNKPENRSKKEMIKKRSDEKAKEFVDSRNDQNALLFNDKKGGSVTSMKGYQILEGNRRVLKAVADEVDEIKAYVGEFANDADSHPRNYWISTGFLRNLVSLADDAIANNDQASLLAIEKVITQSLESSDSAKIVFKLRVLQRTPAGEYFKERLSKYLS